MTETAPDPAATPREIEAAAAAALRALRVAAHRLDEARRAHEAAARRCARLALAYRALRRLQTTLRLASPGYPR